MATASPASPTDRATIDQLRSILRDAAEIEILPRFKRLAVGDISTKSGPQDLVTVADQAAERLIQARVAELLPDALFVGEESVAADPALLDRLADADLAIVVDPIDGTFNFANGLPLFGVMAAIVAHGEIVAGVIYDPFAQDWAWAIAGQGAWLTTLDGRETPLTVAAPVPLDQMHGMLGWTYLTEPFRTRALTRLPKVASSYGYRCAAHEYRLAAAGGAHFVVYGKLMPWDHAPGWLIHKEAGGHSALVGGAPYSPRIHEGILVLAPDATSWTTLTEALFAP